MGQTASIGWTKIYFYLGGMDVPFPTENRSKHFEQAARTIEKNIDQEAQRVGNEQRIKNIRN